MASIVTNGVILEVPYAIIRNVRNSRPWTLSVVGRDTRQYAYDQKLLRSFPASRTVTDIFVYAGDVITFSLLGPVNDATAAAFDVYSVLFHSLPGHDAGEETKVTEVGFNAVWQKQVVLTISAIANPGGTVTYTVAQS